MTTPFQLLLPLIFVPLLEAFDKIEIRTEIETYFEVEVTAKVFRVAKDESKVVLEATMDKPLFPPYVVGYTAEMNMTYANGQLTLRISLIDELLEFQFPVTVEGDGLLVCTSQNSVSASMRIIHDMKPMTGIKALDNQSIHYYAENNNGKITFVEKELWDAFGGNQI